MEQRMSIMTLGVSNMERALAFYEHGMGWKRCEKSIGDLIVFDMAGILLALYPIEELADDVTLPYQRTSFSGITIAHNTRSENEVDEIIEKAIEVGGTLVKKPEKAFWGGYSGYFADPDGYIFEVAFNPFWEI